jgi:hypothetical protein
MVFRRPPRSGLVADVARRVHTLVQHTQDQDIGAAIRAALFDAVEEHVRGSTAPLPSPLDVKRAHSRPKLVARPRARPFGRFRDEAHGRVDQRSIPSALLWSEAARRFQQYAVNLEMGRIAKPVWQWRLASLLFGPFLLGQNIHD